MTPDNMARASATVVVDFIACIVGDSGSVLDDDRVREIMRAAKTSWSRSLDAG